MHHLKFRLLCCFLVVICQFFCACRFYQISPISKHRVKELGKQHLDFYLVDGGNTLTNVWLMKHHSFKKNGISCSLTKVPPATAKEIVLIKSRKDAADSKNYVFLVAKPEFAAKMNPNDSLLNFDYQQLERIQCVELNQTKSITRTIGLILAIALRLGGFLL
jgi:hypothetical protein